MTSKGCRAALIALIVPDGRISLHLPWVSSLRSSPPSAATLPPTSDSRLALARSLSLRFERKKREKCAERETERERTDFSRERALCGRKTCPAYLFFSCLSFSLSFFFYLSFRPTRRPGSDGILDLLRALVESACHLQFANSRSLALNEISSGRGRNANKRHAAKSALV